tara:strand:- start:97 stop:426 length:330 start_codon:yes stop_codon:yes gene_type:complete
MYLYTCKVIRVIDGDTVALEVNLGFNISIRERFRLLGIDAPEVRGDTRNEGLASKEFLEQILKKQTNLTVKTEKNKGSFGRWLGVLYGDRNLNIVRILVENGHAIWKDY